MILMWLELEYEVISDYVAELYDKTKYMWYTWCLEISKCYMGI